MNSKLITLSMFELRRVFLHNFSWVSNAMFLLVNITIFPFTSSPHSKSLSLLFLPVLVTSILLGVVLTTNRIFEEDIKDGSLNQLLTFKIPIYIIYLSKVISASLEFIFIVTIILPIASILYNISFEIILKLWAAIISSIPFLTSVSIFGSILTINLKNNNALATILILPLLISALILLSLSLEQILSSQQIAKSMPYIEISLGLTLLFIPFLCLLIKFFYK